MKYMRVIFDFNPAINRVSIVSSGLYDNGGLDINTAFSSSDKNKFYRSVKTACESFVRNYLKTFTQLEFNI